MVQLPGHLVARYQAYCRGCGINDAERADYLKWLRFFLDFSEKYQVTGEPEERIRKFMDKLQDKKQSEDQRRKARQAVSLYFKMLQNSQGSKKVVTEVLKSDVSTAFPSAIDTKSPIVDSVRKSFYSEAGYQEKSSSPEWDEVLSKMADEIKVRHYSRSVLL